MKLDDLVVKTNDVALAVKMLLHNIFPALLYINCGFAALLCCFQHAVLCFSFSFPLLESNKSE